MDLTAAAATVPSGGSTTLSWTSAGATSCTASGGWTGQRALSGTEQVGPLSSATTFTLSCTGDGGTTSRSVTVSIGSASLPTLSLSTAAEYVLDGGSTQLTWTSTATTGCVARGGWSGPRPISGSEMVGPLRAPASYVLDCTGDGGTASGSVAVSIIPPQTPWQEDIVYQLLTDRFLDGDPTNDNGDGNRPGDPADPTNPVGWHGGDFAGIRQKLEGGYFQQMGFTAIWISPVVIQVPASFNGGGVNSNKLFSGFHGYWADHFDEIEPHFGTLADLQALGRAADEAGVKLIIDVVVNHAGYGSSLIGLHPAWFRPSGAPCGSDPVTECLYGLPDFRQELPEVTEFLDGTIAFLRDHVAVDGLRMDTFRHVGDPFWTQFFAPGSPADPAHLWTVGENASGDPAELVRDMDNLGAPSMLDFPLNLAMTQSLAWGQSTRAIADVLARDAQYADPTRLSTFLDNHDMARFASAAESAGASAADATKRLGMALTFLYTSRGTPIVYYGTENAARGLGDSYDQPLGASSREDMVFAGGTPPLGARLRALADARKAYPALRRGAQTVLLAPAAGAADVLACARTAAGQKPVVVVVNNQLAAVDLATLPGGGVPVSGLLPDGAVVEVTGAAVSLAASGGRLTGTVPPLTALAVAAP